MSINIPKYPKKPRKRDPLTGKIIPKKPKKHRKLKATWTMDLSQDLKAYHSSDAEKELMDTLSKEISNEINNEIMKMLIDELDKNKGISTGA